MPEPFIVGPTGLPLHRFADWRAVLVQRWRSAYGDDADTRPETPDGLMIDTLALLMTLLGDATQSTFANSFFRTSEAPALDLILDLFGRQRLDALPTTVSGVWYGTTATVVHDGLGTGPIASVESAGVSSGDRYEVDEGASGTIPAVTGDGAVVVARVNAVTNTNTYGIDIGGTESTTVAGALDTVQTIAVALAAALLVDNPTFIFATPGQDPSGQALIVIEGKATEDVTVGASTTTAAELDVFPAVRLAMSAEETGPQQVLAGTLNTIETPAGGLEGVTTTLDGLLGRNLETDAEYRLRHVDQINIGGKSTPQRIRAALLAPVEDGGLGEQADFARVIENETGSPSTGAPPQPSHSFRVIFVGSATDAQVAAIIHDQKPAGIQTFGAITEVVLDELGEPTVINFDRGTTRFLHLDIDITPGEGFPTTGDPAQTITSAIVLDLDARLELGTDLLRFSLGTPIGTVPGIAIAVISTATTLVDPGAPVFSVADVVVDVTEILVADSSRITVTIL